MHILYIPSWYPADHAPLNGSFFREQAEALVRYQGLKVGVIAPCPRSLLTLPAGNMVFGFSRTEEGGLDVWRDSYLRVPKIRRLEYFRWIRSAERLYDRYVAEEGQPDLIHAQGAVWGGCVASRIARNRGIPYVLTEHSSGFRRGLYKGWYMQPIRKAFSDAGAVISVSTRLRSLISPYRPQSDILVIPNFIDTDLFSPPSSPVSPVPFRFICIAHLQPNKAVPLLVDAFGQTFAADEPVALDIIGDGPDRPKIEAMIIRHGCSGRVTLHGTLGRLEVRDRLRQSHCCVSSSHVETFGVTLIEALATGIPLIATRSGGPEDIVTDANGHLVPVGDAAALAEAMRAVYRDRHAWRGEAGALRRDAVVRFGAKAATERIAGVYRDVLKRRAPQVEDGQGRV